MESLRDGCLVVRPQGHLAVAQAPELMRVLRKRLSEQQWAVVCDLSHLEVIDPSCAGVLLTVAAQTAGGWPETVLLLCGARPPVTGVLRSLGVQRFLTLHDSLQQALDHAFDRPVFLRDEARLAPTANAPAHARRFVADVCAYWRLAFGQQRAPPGAIEELPLSERVELVTSELVTNATLHAHTDMRLRVELRGDRLYVSVRDAAPGLLSLAESAGLDEGGHGLELVDVLASSWGVRPDGDGKVVWASFRLP